MTAEREDLAGLIAGDKAAWDFFVARFAGLISAAVRRVAGPAEDADDIAQDVFVRLCKDDFRLLRQFDPSRAGLSTWLTIITRSVTYDAIRRRGAATGPLDDVPERVMAVDPVMPEHLKIPPDLLSPRQALVITLLYERDMDVAEIAAILNIDAQTVRSTHHKAMLKLRGHFRDDT